MWNTIVVICWVCSFYVCGMYVEKPGPRFPPTKGEIWPKPQHVVSSEEYFTFNHNHFRVVVTQHSCALLTSKLRKHSLGKELHSIIRRSRKARGEVRENRRSTPDRPHDPLHRGLLRKLEVNLTEPCNDDEYPSFDMRENYNLIVNKNASFEIQSHSIWGIIRGFESVSQLLYLDDDTTEIRINVTTVHDFPRYKHRGLLLDTGRHYISVANIMTTLDAMSMNKLNVLHWHIIDDQSFPYKSDVFPELSKQGAYHKSLLYTKSDIANIIEYARINAIRVIPEFDVPGHTRSWGVAYPNILTQCYEYGKYIGLGPMNPINNSTYKIIRDLFKEVGERFPDKYFHLGGDEVELGCWSSNPQIQDYMKNYNITAVSELHALFMENVIPLVPDDKKSIVWQEVMENNVPLSNDTLVQVWKSEGDLVKVLSAGHLALYSSSWYLDHLASGGDFEDFYLADPADIVQDETLAKNIMGGEACMWGEVVDDRNVLSRVWPRASAVAERLWSPKQPTGRLYRSVHYKVKCRLEEHTCRMIRRGVPAQPPNGPGFCLV